ncbi:Isopentenyl-diphosphate Delta-isomerase [uncultured archaeon]|nr:Isopentenyl-diphosphate Delta-isomerase [uncultured archaeon]
MSQGLMDNPDQKLIAVDSRGRQKGTLVSRFEAHVSPGIKHLAIQILLFGDNNEIILHERPMHKVGGGVLDAPTTHVLHGETPEKAALRCLRDEYGITKRVELKVLEGFSYEKDYGDGSCENEYCLAAFAAYGGPIMPNNDHALSIISMPAKEFLEGLSSEPDKYPIWLHRTVNIVLRDAEGQKPFV